MLPMIPAAPLMWSAYVARMSGWMSWRLLLPALVVAAPLGVAAWAIAQRTAQEDAQPALALAPARKERAGRSRSR